MAKGPSSDHETCSFDTVSHTACARGGQGLTPSKINMSHLCNRRPQVARGEMITVENASGCFSDQAIRSRGGSTPTSSCTNG